MKSRRATPAAKDASHPATAPAQAEAANPPGGRNVDPARRRDQRDLRLVQEVALNHFGTRARRIARCGGGLTNAVFTFQVAQGSFIVRSHEDATRIGAYLREQWATDAARAAGLPVPRVLEVGNLADGRPYLIAERIEGIDGRLVPQRLQLLQALGTAAARLHGVHTHGLGTVFDWSANRLSRHAGWASWLEHGFCVERRLRVLLRHRMLDERAVERLRRTAGTLAKLRRRPCLQHGDLRLKNVLADPESGKLAAIIDWDACISLPPPYWELSIALHDLGPDEKEAFVAGYGLRPKAFEAQLHGIRFFNLLNSADAVEAAAASRDKATLERLRSRLRGNLDLYSA